MPKKKIDHAARGHSDLPPSSAYKWMNCFGWRRTVAQHFAEYGPPPSAGPAAEEGTLAHEKFEAHLRGMVELDPKDPHFDPLMECVEWVEAQPGEKFTEERVDFGEPSGFVGLTGTLDLAIIEPDRVTIADLKFGRVLVEVADARGFPNPQLMTYLLGAINRHGPRPHYRLVILQPRAHHPDGIIRELEVSAATAEAFRFDMEEAADLNYRNGENRVGPWCRDYCPAIASCRAVVLAARQRLRDTPF